MRGYLTRQVDAEAAYTFMNEIFIYCIKDLVVLLFDQAFLFENIPVCHLTNLFPLISL